MTRPHRQNIVDRVMSLINQVLGRPAITKLEPVPVRVPVRREPMPYVRRNRW